ncbi:hypothetical protein BKM31_19210 [[Actinomadura] parvosata subsp. kistnae]|uniref:Uncharacterized protein n=1 Tax=[Actinomadura] parvosata subsp. kistnae TaxID=1909395 RepID=A0A1U9ZZC9_9ACTN|nr:hypothetical protein BKM31_19210 [Nonomuraea sp. ATCC 55076]
MGSALPAESAAGRPCGSSDFGRIPQLGHRVTGENELAVEAALPRLETAGIIALIWSTSL